MVLSSCLRAANSRSVLQKAIDHDRFAVSVTQPRFIACRSSDRVNNGRNGRQDRQQQRPPQRPPLTGIPPTPPKYTDFTEAASHRARTGQHLADPPLRGGRPAPIPIIRNPTPDALNELDVDLELPEELAGAEFDDEEGTSSSASAAASVTASLGDACAAFERIMNPVVKVYCRHTEPNFSLPWQRERQYSSSSSGFAVAFGEPDENGRHPRWLLTNGHAVEYHSQVRVKRRGDDKKFLARVLAIGTECDLALLTVDDEAFWKGLEPMHLGEMPSLQESVAVVGYPVGGDTISVTAGVVSRIEVTTYVHGSTQLLGVQIDAAINSGNSGGPVFDEGGSLVGIAFQSYAGSEVENVGWVIPTSVVAHFLHDFQRNKRYTGFPMLGVQWQRMESDALKRHMKMTEDQRGVLVTHVAATSCSGGVLKPMDVLMKFDGSQVSCDGTVAFRTGERIMFSYLVSQRFVGDTIPLTVLRDGQTLDLEVVLSTPAPLVPPHLASRDPEYFVFSGLVFTAASEPYLASEYGADFLSLAPVALLEKVCYGRPREADEQVVLLSQVLACDATVGFEDVTNEQVLKFNGQPVKNLLELACMLRAAEEEEFLVFDLDHDEVLVLDAKQARESTPEILRVHNIPRQMSEGLEKQLESK